MALGIFALRPSKRDFFLIKLTFYITKIASDIIYLRINRYSSNLFSLTIIKFSIFGGANGCIVVL